MIVLRDRKGNMVSKFSDEASVLLREKLTTSKEVKSFLKKNGETGFEVVVDLSLTLYLRGQQVTLYAWKGHKFWEEM